MTTDTRRRTVGNAEPINPEMGEGRHQDALRRLRERIASGLPFVAWDSNARGNKDTHCSWGLCTNDLEQWPDKDDHLWPESFARDGRSAPRDPAGGCPMDTRTGTPKEASDGCFYTCRVFRHGERPTVKRALELYDDVIARREAAHGLRLTRDDNEPWRCSR